MNGAGGYIGTIDTAALHDAEIDDALDGAVAGDLAEAPDEFLLPDENIRSALSRFDALQVEICRCFSPAASARWRAI